MTSIVLLCALLGQTEYPITVEKVSDGDTFTCTIHLGFDVSLSRQSVRINDFDAYETSRIRQTVEVTDEEIRRGKIAKQALIDLFAKAERITVVPPKKYRGAYGRLTLYVYVDGRSVGELMKDLGHDRRITW